MESERKTSRLEPERYDLEILLRRPSLRTNIPRRISQVRREAVLDEDTICGFGGLRSEWLQSFANRKTYIFVYGVLGSFYGSYCANFYGIITTLEKLYGFSSRTTGFIASMNNVMLLLVCFILSICIPKNHKPSWIGLGIYIIMASGILSTMPHFLGEKGESFKVFENSTVQNKKSKTEICFEDFHKCSDKGKEEHMTIVILFLSQIILGVGGSLFFTLGKSYKEENIKMYQAPALLCLLCISKILGPAFGYWLSSMCLKIFVSPGALTNINEDNPHWTGAWWLGNLIISFMLFILGAFVILFPNKLPKAVVEGLTQDKMESSKQNLNEARMTFSNFISKTAMGFSEFSRIINLFGFTAYFVFLPKYAEIQYRQSASNANLITGSGTLICAAFGTVLASSIITRYRPCAKALAAWDAFVGVLLICSLASYIYFGCHENDNQIKALIAQLHDKSFNCKCEEFQFSPLCDIQKGTFITTCHYGCNNLSFNGSNKISTNCHYLLSNSNETDSISPGICPVDCHYRFMIFTIITCSIAFLYATSQISKIWFEIRHNDKKLSSNKINFGLALFRLILFIPSPILYGYILDKTCLLWDNCTENSNCWLYDNAKLRYLINLTAVAFTIISICCDLGHWYSIRNFKLFDDRIQNPDQLVEN